MILSKIVLIFGYKYDKSIIPPGPYCYKPDIEKNKDYGKNDKYIYYITPCPYYKKLFKNMNGCKYYGIITDDFVFNDQCKICDINDFSEEEELLKQRISKIEKIKTMTNTLKNQIELLEKRKNVLDKELNETIIEILNLQQLCTHKDENNNNTYLYSGTNMHHDFYKCTICGHIKNKK